MPPCTVKYLASAHPGLSAHPTIFLSLLQAPIHIVSAHLRERRTRQAPTFLPGDSNSKKRTESMISSLPVLQSIAVLIDYMYLPVSTSTDNEVDDINDYAIHFRT